MNEHLRQLQDKAWDLKELMDELAPRKLTDADIATVQSVQRDLDRLHLKLITLRDKYKARGRKKSNAPAAPAPEKDIDELPYG